MASHSVAKTDRLLSLDVFRGVTVAAMVLVTNPGAYGVAYAQLQHAKWYNPTATDMIFPSFLVASGIAMTFSIQSRLRRGLSRSQIFLQILWRALLLILIGLLVNGFPYYDLSTIRIPGILQRIALCYIAGAGIYLVLSAWFASSRSVRVITLAAKAAGMLALYWLLIKLVPVPGYGAGHLDSAGNLAGYIDRLVITVPHMWPYGTTPGLGVTYDPEGLLSTLGAAATFLFGVIGGEWMQAPYTTRRKLGFSAGLGALLVVAGIFLSAWMPSIKWLWTPTFAIFSGGVALLVFAFFYAVLDVWRIRGWEMPALVFGTNAILGFALSNIITTLTNEIHLGEQHIPLHAWLFQRWFAPWAQPLHASLFYALAMVLLNFALLYPLYRRRWFVRV